MGFFAVFALENTVALDETVPVNEYARFSPLLQNILQLNSHSTNITAVRIMPAVTYILYMK